MVEKEYTLVKKTKKKPKRTNYFKAYKIKNLLLPVLKIGAQSYFNSHTSLHRDEHPLKFTGQKLENKKPSKAFQNYLSYPTTVPCAIDHKCIFPISKYTTQ